MTTKEPAISARRQAQDLAYTAMESYDPKKAIRLCAKAIEIDPRCVDALTLASQAFDVDERVLRLEHAVEIAAEDLGGQNYLEENKGHFWRLLETRPYMRARSYLAATLREAGKSNAAITEYEALLELNPNDNQGLRYLLIALYLETGDLAGVRDLRDEYGDSGAVFAWSAVMERLISGDSPGAERSLANARAANSYVEGYLLGRNHMPRVRPDYYGFGDENEAIMCIDTIGDAWTKNPEALRWLRVNESASQAVTRPKVGRNDPCPCGSGKKYKKCCLGQQETPSLLGPSPVAAEMALNEIRDAIADGEFSSEEELEAFIQQTSRQCDRRPRDDFQGLSPNHVHRLINFPFESTAIVEFPSVLSAPPSAPIAALFRMLADAIGESGLKPTATGNLPLKVVREIAQTYMGDEKYAEFTQYGSVRSESDFYDLHITRIVAGVAGLIRHYKGKFILSRECRRLLNGDGMLAIYPLLLRAHAEKCNWGYWDNYPQVGFVQSFFAYTLYLLDRYGDQWRENTFYGEAFLTAFPAIVDTVKPTTYKTREDIIRGMLSLRCLKRFAEFMGLVEIEPTSENFLGRVFRLRKAPLLGDAVRFHPPS
jgi:tetratricopeptide (TPR) repeat protein